MLAGARAACTPELAGQQELGLAPMKRPDGCAHSRPEAGAAQSSWQPPALTTVSRSSLVCVAWAAGAESPRQSHRKPCSPAGRREGRRQLQLACSEPPPPHPTHTHTHTPHTPTHTHTEPAH